MSPPKNSRKATPDVKRTDKRATKVTLDISSLGEYALLLNSLSDRSQRHLLPFAKIDDIDKMLELFLTQSPQSRQDSIRSAGIWLPDDARKRLELLVGMGLMQSYSDITDETAKKIQQTSPQIFFVYAEKSEKRYSFLTLFNERMPSVVVAIVDRESSPIIDKPPFWADLVLPLSLTDQFLRLHINQLIDLARSREDMEALFIVYKIRSYHLKILPVQFAEQSCRDPLTGALNRTPLDHLFFDEAKHALAEAKLLGFLLIDIDHFKNINDTYGHPVGDRILIDIVKIFHELFCFEESRHTTAYKIRDELGRIILGVPHIIRLGGEEFAIIIPSSTSEMILATSEKVRSTVENAHFEATPTSGAITISIGVLIISPSSRGNFDEIYSRADENLYKAKQQGRNRIVSTTYKMGR